MAFVGGDNFFAQLAVFRLVWLRGRLGGGKTLLGVAICEELAARKIVRGVIANIPVDGKYLTPHGWRDIIHVESGDTAPDEVKQGWYASSESRDALRKAGYGYRLMRGAALLYDEAWQQLDNRSSMTNNRAYGAFARKMDTYWIFPSVLALDKRVSYLAVERLKRVRVPVVAGLLAWLGKLRGFKALVAGPAKWLSDEMWQYRWTLNLGYTEDTGTFWLMNPAEYFLHYDTAYVPMSDGGISELWVRTVMEDKAADVGEGSWYVYEDEQEEDEWQYLAGGHDVAVAIAARLTSDAAGVVDGQ